MTETTVFKSNRSQAVRLPKAVALPDEVQRVKVDPQGQGGRLSSIGHGCEDGPRTGPMTGWPNASEADRGGGAAPTMGHRL